MGYPTQDRIFQIWCTRSMIPSLLQTTQCWEITFSGLPLCNKHAKLPMLLFLCIVITCWPTISMTTSISVDSLICSLGNPSIQISVTFCGDFTVWRHISAWSKISFLSVSLSSSSVMLSRAILVPRPSPRRSMSVKIRKADVALIHFRGMSEKGVVLYDEHERHILHGFLEFYF